MGALGGKDHMAFALAIGLSLAVLALTIGVVYDAIEDPSFAGLSENAAQVITGAFGGIIGILGAYLGFRAGNGKDTDADRS
jgi:hypothetical protein